MPDKTIIPVIPGYHTEGDRQYNEGLEEYFSRSLGNAVDKLRTFTKFVPRTELARFLAKAELFKHVLDVHGHIIECGVFLGGGLMTWAQLSAIFEPLNHIRRIVGFDSFTGFTGISSKDRSSEGDSALLREGALAVPAYDDLCESIKLYDLNRPIGHIPRVALEVGDATQTIPAYLAKNPHLVVAMLYLDFDVYEPTKLALNTFLPRMPKGAILAFDQLNQQHWPGETMAVFDTVGLRALRIQRFPFQAQISYAVLE